MGLACPMGACPLGGLCPQPGPPSALLPPPPLHRGPGPSSSPPWRTPFLLAPLPGNTVGIWEMYTGLTPLYQGVTPQAGVALLGDPAPGSALTPMGVWVTPADQPANVRQLA
jgi:hypothetical protein